MTPMRHKIGCGLLVAAALVPIFMLYQLPDFLLMLASHAWSCF